MTNRLLKEFELYFPSFYANMVSYREDGIYDLKIELNDGSSFIFDGIDKSIRRVPNSCNSMTDDECKNEFGVRLRRMMRLRGITQEELSRVTGIHQTNLSKYITGDMCPSFSKVDRICKALDCSMDDLRYLDIE